MGTLLDLASLVVVPSGYKEDKIYSVVPTDGSGDLDFTRASNATRVNSDGLIEKVRTNLFTYSEQLDNAAWTKNVTTITANAIVAPDGTTTADKMADSDTTNAARYTFQSSASSGTIYTSSGYFKKGEYNFVTLHAFGISGALFNLDTGVIVSQSGGVGSIESVGNGWYRCSFAFTAGGSSVFFSQSPAGIITYAGTTGSGIYAWGLQLETGDIATPYIPTTTAAVSVGMTADVPRLDYLGSSCPRLLLEPQRTNVALYSEQFDNASWNKIDSSVTANTTISPDGFTNADTIAFTASAAARCEQGLSGVFESQSHTVSVYAKVASGTGTFRLKCTHSSIDDYFSSDFTATTQWQRFTFTQAFGASVGSGINFGIINGTNALAKNVIFYGFQTEINASYATSYIPTLGTSATRVADAASKTGISDLIGATEGTLFAQFKGVTSGGNGASRLSISDSTSSNWIFVGTESNSLRGFINANGSNIISDTSVFTTGNDKIAIAYKSGNAALYINGVQIATSTTAFTFSGTLSEVTSGVAGTFSVDETLELNQLVVFPTRLSNTELAQLTTI
jgi:hypothetical protein